MVVFQTRIIGWRRTRSSGSESGTGSTDAPLTSRRHSWLILVGTSSSRGWTPMLGCTSTANSSSRVTICLSAMRWMCVATYGAPIPSSSTSPPHSRLPSPSTKPRGSSTTQRTTTMPSSGSPSSPARHPTTTAGTGVSECSPWALGVPFAYSSGGRATSPIVHS